jgi:hypothetical protein
MYAQGANFTPRHPQILPQCWQGANIFVGANFSFVCLEVEGLAPEAVEAEL